MSFTSRFNDEGKEDVELYYIVELRGTLDENVFFTDDTNDEIPFVDLGTDECVSILSTIEKYAKSIGVDIED